MAKKGQEIEALYISLGLNIEDLKLGFDTAGKTVSQSLKKLNQENKKIQIKTDVDLAKLQAAGSELDKIKEMAVCISAVWEFYLFYFLLRHLYLPFWQ